MKKKFSYKVRGYVLISISVFSLLLISTAGLIYYKTIHLESLYQGWLQKRILLLELDSLTPILKKKTAQLAPENLHQQKKDFLQIEVGSKNRWSIEKRASDPSGDKVIYDLEYLPKKIKFRKEIIIE